MRCLKDRRSPCLIGLSLVAHGRFAQEDILDEDDVIHKLEGVCQNESHMREML